MEIRRIFNAVFRHEEQIPRQQILKYAAWSMLFVLNTQIVIFFHILPENCLRWMSILITLDVTLPVALLLNRRGHTRLASVLTLGVIWLLVTVLSLTSGGIRGPTIVAFVVDVLLAGLLFGGRGGVIAAAIFCVTGLFLALLEMTGHLPEPTVFHTPVSIWLLLTMFLELAMIFQLMATHAISKALVQAKDSEQRYREVFETTSDCVFLLDVTEAGDFLVHAWNPMTEKVCGLSSAHVTGKLPEQIFPPDVAKSVTGHYKDCIAKKEPISYEEVISVGGPVYNFFTTLIPVKNHGGRITRIIGVAHNITERKQAEESLRQSRDELEGRVQERTTELQKVNRELEAFSYSVSHDLRRPLRSVIGSADLLVSDYGEALPEDGRELLTMIKSGTVQMNGLIEALLNLSRVERQSLRLRVTNLAQIARELAKELREEHPARKLDFHIADMPECLGDPDLLRQVLVNLLSNAVKFTANRSVAVIEVGCKHGDDRITYFVRDNGAGFDMRHANRLFGVFQRLHDPEEFSGTGVGLSIVQRIILRHGGTIWAEAAVNQGATFYFTLPPATAHGPGG